MTDAEDAVTMADRGAITVAAEVVTNDPLQLQQPQPQLQRRQKHPQHQPPAINRPVTARQRSKNHGPSSIWTSALLSPP